MAPAAAMIAALRRAARRGFGSRSPTSTKRKMAATCWDTPFPSKPPTPPAPSDAGPYSVCIGDVCQSGVPGAANFIFSCSFAYANPSNTDEAAAKYVCTQVYNFSGCTWVRYAAGGNGGCGYIFDSVKCRNDPPKCGRRPPASMSSKSIVTVDSTEQT
jgi:hypothetical protein